VVLEDDCHRYLHGATVESIMGEEPKAIQRSMQGGRRDARRMVIHSGQRYVTLSLAQDAARRWRICDLSMDDVTVGRTHSLPVMHHNLVDSGNLTHSTRSSSARGTQHGLPVLHTTPEERIAAWREGERQGLVALWEWCQLAGMKQALEAPPALWSVYSEGQNNEIEQAFRTGEERAPICVGMRSYDIVFLSSIYAQQVDSTYRKRRLVRRSLMTTVQLHEAFATSALAMETLSQSVTIDQEMCPICCEYFQDTRLQPVAKLLDCGHVFHAACVQVLADRNSTCPACRSAVRWEETMSTALALMASARMG